MCFLSSKSRRYTKPPTKKYHRDPISGIMYPTSSTRRKNTTISFKDPRFDVHVDEMPSDGEDDYYGSYDGLISTRSRRDRRLRFTEDEDRLTKLEEYSAVRDLKDWHAATLENEKLSAAEAKGKAAGRAERDSQLKTEAEATATLDARIKRATEGPEGKIQALEARLAQEERERERRAVYAAGLSGLPYTGTSKNEVGATSGYPAVMGGPPPGMPPVYSAAAAAYAYPSHAYPPPLPHHPYQYTYAPVSYAQPPPPPPPASTPASASPQRHVHEYNVRFENFDGNALAKSINSAAGGLEKLSLEAMKSRNFQAEVEKGRERDRYEARERRGRKVFFDDGSVDERWDS